MAKKAREHFALGLFTPAPVIPRVLAAVEQAIDSGGPIPPGIVEHLDPSVEAEVASVFDPQTDPAQDGDT